MECGVEMVEGAELPEVWQVEQGVLVDVERMLEQWVVATVDGVLEQDGTVELEGEGMQQRPCGRGKPRSWAVAGTTMA